MTLLNLEPFAAMSAILSDYQVNIQLLSHRDAFGVEN